MNSKMRTIVFLNGANVGSTGRIVYGISALAEKRGYRCFRAYPKSRNLLPPKENDIIISSVPEKFLSTRTAYLSGMNGCVAWAATARLLKKLDRIQPDVLHLHNLHDSYINLPMLFRWIKSHDVKVVWTLHDCWSFTGHCPHFMISGCDKWKSGCGHCPQLNIYPKLRFDTTAWLWKKKKGWFTGVKDLTIVTPSEWLAGLVRESFLKEYPIEVINNGIDLKTFQPTESDFRKTHGLSELGAAATASGKPEYMVLGVSMEWGKQKGLDVFEYLAERLGEQYRVVLVGTNEAVDEKLPKNILSIHRTHDAKELAAIYSAADVFVNPSAEETFSLVTAEALACGTPVVVRGGSAVAELVKAECGVILNDPTTKDYITAILSLAEKDVSDDRISESVSGYTLRNMTDEILCIYRGTLRNNSER